MYKAVHYINQFFAGVGGEQSANISPYVVEGAVGFGKEIEKLSKNRIKISHTIICGDNYAAEHPEELKKQTLSWFQEIKPDIFIAGPAFAAGRFGLACGTLCEMVGKRLQIPCVSGMHETNPGIEIAKKTTFIIETKDSVRDLKRTLERMVMLSLKILDGQYIGGPTEEGYHPRGIRVNVRREKRGSKRAVEMLLNKLGGKNFETELPMPIFDHVPPAPALQNISESLIAAGTEGGIVPRGNPDKIEAHNASKWCMYSIEEISKLKKEDYEVAHGGYDPVPATQDPNRVLPIDGLRILEKKGLFRKLLEKYFVTVGNVTAVKSAEKYGKEIASMLQNEGVNGVVMTST